MTDQNDRDSLETRDTNASEQFAQNIKHALTAYTASVTDREGV